MTDKEHLPGKNEKFKKFIINGLLFSFSIVITFTILEIAYRIIEMINEASSPNIIRESINRDELKDAQNVSWVTFDKDLGYKLRPNYGDFNSDGLRDDPISPNKDHFRLLMLGDSQFFIGGSRDSTIPGRLEQLLKKDTTLNSIRVINAGIPGYTNYQELIFLKKYGLRFHPDLVCIGFVLNDLHKFLHQFEIRDDKIVGDNWVFTEKAKGSVEYPLFERLFQKSHFFRWLRYRLAIVNNLLKLMREKGYSFDYRTDVNTAWKDEYWVQIEKQFNEFITLSKNYHFKLFVVVFPFGEQYRWDYLHRDKTYVLKPQTKLRQICAKFEIPFLDLYPFLSYEDHFKDDLIHLNDRGLQTSAQYIALELKSRNLLPLNKKKRSIKP
ncbi:MAG: SGNH/GDSL hydrolase family protein [Calditrichaeota bacterium]|nr:MAG: SGNH/GDSL hydrolase family protein [Calditrichota bacterium]